MRTTLTIDNHTYALLKEKAMQMDKPFKQVVNEVLLLGINKLEHPDPSPYHLQPVSMGQPRQGINLDKAVNLAEDMEDKEITAKLEKRK